jgi:hypothetical protein
MSRDTLIKMLFAAVISDGGLLMLCIKCNLVYPLQFLLFRHMQTYQMGSMVWMVAGYATGATFVGHALFTFGNDPIQRMHTGNFSLWAKSLVQAQENIAIARDIYCKSYICGGGTKFWKYYNQQHRDIYLGEISPEDHDLADLHCVAVPASWTPAGPYMDITGNYDPAYCSNVSNEVHYPTAPLYASYWGWAHREGDEGRNPWNIEMWSVQEPRYNTIVCQGHQKGWVHTGQGQGEVEIVNQGQGHWGENVYPGVGKARNGFEFYIKSLSFKNKPVPIWSV